MNTFSRTSFAPALDALHPSDVVQVKCEISPEEKNQAWTQAEAKPPASRAFVTSHITKSLQPTLK